MKELEPIRAGAPQSIEVLPAAITQPAPAPNPVSHAPQPEEGPGVNDYLRMLRRHPAILITTLVLGAIGGFISTLSEPRVYQAWTTLEIQGLNEDFLNMRNINPTVQATSSFYPEYDIQTQVRILQSKSLNQRVVARMKALGPPPNLIPPDRLSVWRKALKVSAPGQGQLWQQALSWAAGSIRGKATPMTRIIEVGCESTNPQTAAKFLDVLAEEYIEQNLEARWKSTEHTGEWLTRQLQDLKAKLEKAQDELQAYSTATGLVFTSNDKNTTIDDLGMAQLSGLQREMTEAEADRVKKESHYQMVSKVPIDSVSDVLDDQQLSASQQHLAELRRQLAQLRVSFTPNHPDVRRIEAQIAAVQTELLQRRDRILQRIRNDYEAAAHREKLLTSSYETQARLVSEKAAQIVHHNLLKREVDTTRDLYESMLQKLKEASVASALRASNIRVVDGASTPGTPSRPDVSRTTMAGALMGIGLGLAFVIIRERSDRTIQGPGEPAYYLKVPELGVVPLGGSVLKGYRGYIDSGSSARPGGALELSTFVDRTSLLAESFRNTLTSILFADQNAETRRVLVLTSASPKEGKTTLVSNLSIALAEIQPRVLLIDADTRRPRVHSVFGLENEYGLTDLLGHEGPLDWETVEQAIRPTSVPHLFIMTSGRSHSASNLLYSARLPELLRMARVRFDSTLIDTPPMVNIADARVVGRHADGVILVVRSAVTTRDAALRAKQRLGEDGITVLGTILNAWNPKMPGYKYYKYYRNYYDGYYHYYSGDNGNSSSSSSSNGNGKGKSKGKKNS